MYQDLRWALRWLGKNPLFTVAVAAILAVGIGANTAVFSIVDAVLLRPSPFLAAGRLVKVEETSTARLMGGVPVKDLEQWSGQSDVFEKAAPYLRDTVTLTGGGGDPEQLIAVRSIGLMPMLGVAAQLGRPLLPDDDAEGTRNVTVLSDRLWKRRYQGNPRVIGRAIDISGEAYTVVGVMPPDFEFRYPEAELWTPLRITPTSPWLQVVARLRSGISAAQAGSALEVVARRMEQEQPKDRPGLKIVVTPWSGMPDGKYQLTLVFVLIAVGLVMLIVCADVGGLLLSRAVERQKEIAIRASLGAGMGRIVRQLLAESLVLSVLGSLAGILVARGLLQVLTKQLAALPVALPHLQRVGLNGRVLVFSVALCLLLAVLCSLAPVLLAARADLQSVMRGGQTAGPRGTSRLFATLIGVEAGFAFLLLVGSGLMIRSLVQLQREDHGFRPEQVLTLRVPVGTLTQPRPTGKYDTKARQMAYYREILGRIRAVPGIKAAAVVNNLPLSGINTSLSFNLPDSSGKPQLTSARTISPEYFAAMGIPLLAGRDFTDADRAGSPSVAIINEFLSRQRFPDRSPLGERLPGEGTSPGPTIVGVVKDTPQMSYELPAKAEIYVPNQQVIFATFMSTVVVRTSRDPLEVAPALRKEIWAVDPNQPVVKVETMEEVIENAIWRPRFSAWIFSVLSGLAVLLTATGVYSVIAYTSTLRAREVGIRVALGATPGEVVRVILRGAMIPLAIGLAVSAVAALFLSRLLTALLYGVTASDPLTYLSAGFLLLAIGVAASARPAWRAATRDSLATLRAE